ncbi:MAG: GspH/FimT family pseudopilin [Thiohalomonadales bacterium]
MDVSLFKRSLGLTLIELLVTLAVSSIVLTYATPEVRTLFKINQNAVIINSLVADLAYTRSEAIKRLHDVVICKSADGQICNNKSDWQDGWIIYVDEVKRDKQRGPDEALLKVQQALGNNIKIRFTSFNSKNRVVYRPSGAADYSNGTFRFCTNNEQYHKDLILSRTGRTYLKVNPGLIFRKSNMC